MITIDLGTIETFNSETNMFEYHEGGIVNFEYSLRVMYEWEGYWKVPFLNIKDSHSDRQMTDFYMRMASKPINPMFLTPSVTKKLSEYINSSPTATTFQNNKPDPGPKVKTPKVYTAEEIYSLMFQAGIPLEFENRNLNRLMVILRIISISNNPSKKMSRSEILQRNSRINEERKRKYNTKG